MVSRHKNEVATQNLVKGKTVRSQQESVIATQTLGDQRKLSRRGPNWLTTKKVLRQRNFVATHTSAKEETIKSRHEIVVVTSTARNKRKLSQPESSLLETNMVTTQQSKSRLQIDDSQENC